MDIMSDENDSHTATRHAKYGQLPPVVRIEEMTTGQETEPARDPKGGRDTDTEFLTRYCGS
jgi:hypothetical protein